MRPCGHHLTLSCRDGFFRSFGPCQERVEVTCPDCHIVRPRRCHEYELERAAGAAPPCLNVVQKVCGVCGVNACRVPCYVGAVECKRDALAMLACGHTAQVRLGCVVVLIRCFVVCWACCLV